MGKDSVTAKRSPIEGESSFEGFFFGGLISLELLVLTRHFKIAQKELCLSSGILIIERSINGHFMLEWGLTWF